MPEYLQQVFIRNRQESFFEKKCLNIVQTVLICC